MMKVGSMLAAEGIERPSFASPWEISSLYYLYVPTVEPAAGAVLSFWCLVCGPLRDTVRGVGCHKRLDHWLQRC
jgi:hypothetical protein